MKVDEMDPLDYRKPEHDVSPVFPKRWSPRAMSGEPITDEELMSLFEAARWAPSSYNAQPWRFVYARRGTEHWDRLFGLMSDFNKSWTKNAAVLVVVISRDRFEYNNMPSVTHEFDAGAAWENLALQASSMGLVAHGMQGFNYERARRELDIPGSYTVQAMIAIGKPGDTEDLPEELREREEPSTRKGVGEFVFEGRFGRGPAAAVQDKA